MPTVSVITPTYRTAPETLARTWASLKAQTFTDWEWVVYDDTPDDTVWRHLWGLCADERHRIVPIRSMGNCGNIGRVKRRGFMVAEGDLLVELDHDDELTPDALTHVVEAFADPAVGFVFSDWCEILPDGVSGRYPEGWAFGYGTDYWSSEHGCWVMSAPPINPTTVRHIVSAPNHVRAWRAGTYRSLGGHDPRFDVADDYELIVRTLCTTQAVHIPRMLYRQHISPDTAQRVRNTRIQQLIPEIVTLHAELLDERFPL